jgi:hypothetical protein
MADISVANPISIVYPETAEFNLETAFTLITAAVLIVVTFAITFIARFR